MEDQIINVFIESGILESTGLYDGHQYLESAARINEYLDKQISSDNIKECRMLLWEYASEIEHKSLVAGFKLGVNLMKESQFRK
jgi:hypothetical protein